ncbi:hypothetical protein FQN49_005907 [Arthroderma sp. PD_2]|nr:hypothetical protein FQN49_005907 [Arthroderma sp. PD_2]
MAISTQAKNKIMTGAVAIITATGAIWGANLKMNQDEQQRIQRNIAATPEEKINTLLVVRENLVAKRAILEQQIKGIEARQADKAELSRQKELYQQQQRNERQGAQHTRLSTQPYADFPNLAVLAHEGHRMNIAQLEGQAQVQK